MKKPKRVGNRYWRPLWLLVRPARDMHALGLSVRQIARALGVSKSWVHETVRSMEPNFPGKNPDA